MENNPTWTCVVALALQDDHGRWLMHQRPLNKRHGGLWEFPGGKVEGRESPSDALVREIAEELGVTVDIGDLAPAAFAQEAPGSRPSPIVILLYTCRTWTGRPTALEGEAVGWFTSAEMVELARPPLDVELCRTLARLTAS